MIFDSCFYRFAATCGNCVNCKVKAKSSINYGSEGAPPQLRPDSFFPAPLQPLFLLLVVRSAPRVQVLVVLVGGPGLVSGEGALQTQVGGFLIFLPEHQFVPLFGREGVDEVESGLDEVCLAQLHPDLQYLLEEGFEESELGQLRLAEGGDVFGD